MTELMIDTGLFAAALSKRDDHHPDARRLFGLIADGRWEVTHTTEHVLWEIYNYVRAKLPHPRVARLLRELLLGEPSRDPIIHRIHPIPRRQLSDALDHYHDRFDQGLSLTDWTTVICMEDQGIEELASFDTGFDGVVTRVPGPA